MKRFILVLTLLTAFQLGQLSKMDINKIIEPPALAVGFTIYFWVAGFTLLLIFTIYLWRSLNEGSSQSNKRKPSC